MATTVLTSLSCTSPADSKGSIRRTSLRQDQPYEADRSCMDKDNSRCISLIALGLALSSMIRAVSAAMGRIASLHNITATLAAYWLSIGANIRAQVQEIRLQTDRPPLVKCVDSPACTCHLVAGATLCTARWKCYAEARSSLSETEESARSRLSRSIPVLLPR